MEKKNRREPQGFGEHTRKQSSENAHEQGWGLNEDERRRLPQEKQDYQGGRDYDYGARDFGDTPVDTKKAVAKVGARDTKTRRTGRAAVSGKDQRASTRRG